MSSGGQRHTLVGLISWLLQAMCAMPQLPAATRPRSTFGSDTVARSCWSPNLGSRPMRACISTLSVNLVEAVARMALMASFGSSSVVRLGTLAIMALKRLERGFSRLTFCCCGRAVSTSSSSSSSMAATRTTTGASCGRWATRPNVCGAAKGRHGAGPPATRRAGCSSRDCIRSAIVGAGGSGGRGAGLLRAAVRGGASELAQASLRTPAVLLRRHTGLSPRVLVARNDCREGAWRTHAHMPLPFTSQEGPTLTHGHSVWGVPPPSPPPFPSTQGGARLMYS